VSGRRVFSGRRRGLGRPGKGGGSFGWGGPHAAPGAGRGVRQSPDRLRRRQEQVLLATVINHPEILAEHAEELTAVELAGADLRRLAQALVDAVAAAPDLDTGALKCHLCEQGYSKMLEDLLSQQIYVHGGFARPETPLAEARLKWTNFLALHRQRQADTETAKAVRLLAEDLSDERLARLQASQRSAEGGESRRVEFDSPEPAESPESG
jgi:DNA primase